MLCPICDYDLRASTDRFPLSPSRSALSCCPAPFDDDNPPMELEDEDLDRRTLPGRRSWIKSRLRMAVNRLGAAGVMMLTGGHAWRTLPFQVEWTNIDMPLRGLPPSFDGFRIAQVTDLHTGRSTPTRFLAQIIQRVNESKPDLVVVTGDLVTHSRRWVPVAAELLSRLRAPVVVTFGNHDYAPSPDTWSSTEVADLLEAHLTRRGMTVLRNRAMPIEHADGRIWLVGMEDLWSRRFHAKAAFDGIDRAEPIIALTHNPDTVFPLVRRGAQWVLAGHTHGGQIRVPVAGALILPLRHKEFDQGLFDVRGGRLYVCRGVGFRLQVRFRCPPEVATFTLRPAV